MMVIVNSFPSLILYWKMLIIGSFLCLILYWIDGDHRQFSKFNCWSVRASYIDLCNEVCSSSGPAVLHGKNLNVGYYTQTFKPIFFIPAMLMSTIDFYCFIHFQWPWSWQGGRKVSTKQNLLASFSHFSTDQEEIWYGVEAIQVQHSDTFEWIQMYSEWTV